MIGNPDKIVLLIIIATSLFSYKGFQDYSFFEKYKFQVTRILNGEKIRMFTSGLLHANWMHLILNMYVLHLFGGIVIRDLGTIPFLAVYIGSLFTGSLYSLSYHKNEPYYSAIGASGAVSGIVYASILLNPMRPLGLIFIPVYIPGYIFGVIYLLYSMYGMKKQIGNIGHSAHLGGAIGGYALTLVFYPEVFSENRAMVIALTIPILILLLFGKKLRI
jgi:membrane associated rhomboid family serine protease